MNLRASAWAVYLFASFQSGVACDGVGVLSVLYGSYDAREGKTELAKRLPAVITLMIDVVLDYG